jgi:hypothetical protein
VSEDQRKRWLKFGAVLLDLLVLVCLVSVAQSYWPRGAGHQTVVLQGMQAPAWGTVQDLLMTGPDAGEWARNALHIHNGQADQVDPHRMPTWLGLTALAMKFTGSVVSAGHLVNHLLHVALVLVLYGLGRAGGGRGVGLLAAAFGGLFPHLIADSRTFGIDVLVATAIPGSVLAGVMAARWWPLAFLGGVLASFASLSHFTTLPYVLPALVLVMLRGPRSWWRWSLAVGGYCLGAYLTVWWVYQYVPMPNQTVLMHSLGEGIAPSQSKQMQDQIDLSLTMLQSGTLSSLESAVATGVQGVRPAWLPWSLAVLGIWLGLVGAGLGRGAPEGAGRVRRVLGRCDLGLGIPLLLCLAPLAPMIAVGAPSRYMDNLLGPAAVLLARGVVSPLALAELGLKRLWRLWPVGLLSLGLGAGVLWNTDQGMSAWKRPSMPNQEGMLHARLAWLLSQRLPAGSGVSSSARAALVMSEMELCPRTACPLGNSETYYWSCLQVLAQECAGDESIGWVTTDWSQQDPFSLNRQSMSTWIAERWELQGKVMAAGRAHRLYLIPREDITSGRRVIP